MDGWMLLDSMYYVSTLCCECEPSSL